MEIIKAGCPAIIIDEFLCNYKHQCAPNRAAHTHRSRDFSSWSLLSAHVACIISSTPPTSSMTRLVCAIYPTNCEIKFQNNFHCISLFESEKFCSAWLLFSGSHNDHKYYSKIIILGWVEDGQRTLKSWITSERQERVTVTVSGQSIGFCNPSGFCNYTIDCADLQKVSGDYYPVWYCFLHRSYDRTKCWISNDRSKLH
jgi:hypothetical protein